MGTLITVPHCEGGAMLCMSYLLGLAVTARCPANHCEGGAIIGGGTGGGEPTGAGMLSPGVEV